EGRDRRRSALVGVRGPHVERHHRRLEPEADGEECDGESGQTEIGEAPDRPDGMDAEEVRRSGAAEDEGDPVQEERRREGAEDEPPGEDAEVVLHDHAAQRDLETVSLLEVREDPGRDERYEGQDGEVWPALARLRRIEQEEDDRTADERDLGEEGRPALYAG